jgi:hypothetical protein
MSDEPIASEDDHSRVAAAATLRVYELLDTLPAKLRANPKEAYQTFEQFMDQVWYICRQADICYHHWVNDLNTCWKDFETEFGPEDAGERCICGFAGELVVCNGSLECRACGIPFGDPVE